MIIAWPERFAVAGIALVMLFSLFIAMVGDGPNASAIGFVEMTAIFSGTLVFPVWLGLRMLRFLFTGRLI